MTAFLWIMLVTFLLNVFSRTVWILSDEYPKRTRGEALLGLIENIVFSAWAVYLLASMEAANG